MSSSTGLSASQWAAFFHQAAIGTSYMYPLYLNLQKAKNKNTVDVDVSISIPNCFIVILMQKIRTLCIILLLKLMSLINF